MREIQIESSNNEVYRLLSSLVEGRGIRENSLALVHGTKLIRDISRSRSHQIRNLVVTPEQVQANEGETRGLAQGINSRRAEHQKPFHLLVLNRELFQALDTPGTKSPIAVIEISPLQNLDNFGIPTGQSRLILPLSDPQNLGACLRSAAAFGWSDVILTSEAANPFLPRSIRASSGALFELRLTRGPSIAKLTPHRRLWILNQADHARPIEDFSSGNEPIDLVIGEEGQGFGRVPQLDAFQALSIGIDERVESLNAVVAASIALHRLQRKT